MNSTLPAPLLEPTSLLANIRILVIDDDPSLLLALSKALTHRGATVISADGVTEAIPILAEIGQKFDIILSDLRMPFTSGKMILSLVKTTRPDVPVFLMSAYWTSGTKDECINLGAAKCLDKPISSKELVAAIAGELR